MKFPTWELWLAVLVGGAVGSSLRFFGSWALHLWVDLSDFPWDILWINVLGSFVIGAAIAYFTRAPGLSAFWQTLAVPGFLGGFTTYSSFSEGIIRLGGENPRKALLYAATTLALGSFFCYTGHRLGDYFFVK